MPGVQVLYPQRDQAFVPRTLGELNLNIEHSISAVKRSLDIQHHQGHHQAASSVSGMTGPTSPPQVLLCGTLVHARSDLDAHASRAEIFYLSQSTSRAQFIRDLAPGGQYSRITAIIRTNDSSNIIGAFDAELIRAFPPTLRAVCHNGAGYDMIDVAALSSRGILLSNTPKPVSEATATTAVYLMLAALRGYQQAERVARDGHFKKGILPGHNPEGRVLGIVGMGGIGKAIALRALAFDMRIVYHNRRPIPSKELDSLFPSIWRNRIRYASSLDDLLAVSDVVSLSLPLNDSTRNSFGREQFSRMRTGAVLVNTARGAVIQEEALLEALDSGKISTAGLDVFCNEPEIDRRLLAHPKISVLPHMGTETVETQYSMEVCAIENAISAISEGVVNDLVLEMR